MGVEVERKFLVVADGWRCLVLGSQHFGQGYLAAAENCLLRVRVGEERAWLTLKGPDQVTGVEGGFPEGGALRRLEFEYEIPVSEGRQMLQEMAYAAVEKTRFFLADPLSEKGLELAWTVDVFAGRHTGLLLLEVEGEQAAQLSVEDLPEWVGEEVSHDPAYANVNLARA